MPQDVAKARLILYKWVGVRMEVVVGVHAEQKQEGLVACWEMPEHFPSAR